eukprot:4903942-Pyramimonas_sp.AAC.1
MQKKLLPSLLSRLFRGARERPPRAIWAPPSAPFRSPPPLRGNSRQLLGPRGRPKHPPECKRSKQSPGIVLNVPAKAGLGGARADGRAAH